MDFEVRAVLKYTGISPLKTRLVVNQVRGMNADEALSRLRYMSQAAAKPVAKVIRSAIANAEENLELSREDLYVARIFVDQAPSRRWRRFGARGRFKPIIRRSSHITVVLSPRGEA
jgi:large subunit ribosomal protein L22